MALSHWSGRFSTRKPPLADPPSPAGFVVTGVKRMVRLSRSKRLLTMTPSSSSRLTMFPRMVMLPILRPGTCRTSAPPRSVLELGLTRCSVAIAVSEPTATIVLQHIAVRRLVMSVAPPLGPVFPCILGHIGPAVPSPRVAMRATLVGE
jgi:hypothetical protein